MDPFIGEIRLVAFSYAPHGWALCDGRELPINQYQALFALLEATYGGDGVKTFALPKLNGDDLLAGLNYVIAMEGNWPQRA